MAKRSTIASLVAVALLLAGIAVAIVKLYSDIPSRDNDYSVSLSGDWTLLRAVPSDAAAVLVLDGSSAASSILADSSGILKGFLAPRNPELMAFLQSIGRKKMAVSLHNSGSLVPLVVAQVEEGDTLARKMAAQAGLKTDWKEGFLMASRSETFVGAAARHLEEGHSLLGTRGLKDLVGHLSGHAVLLLSHAHADKLLEVYAGKPYRKASFVKGLTAWSGWVLQEDKDQLLLKGTALEGESWESYFAAFKGAPASAPEFPEVVPYYTATALSVPVGDVEAYLASRRKEEDGKGRLGAFSKELKTKSGRPMSPEEWFRSLQPRELVKISFYSGEKLREALLVRSSKDLRLGAESANPYRGCLAIVAGDAFSAVDTVCASIGNRWSAYADVPTLQALQEQSVKEYPLKSRLADASVSLPSGFVAYASLTDAGDLPSSLLAASLAALVKEFTLGAGYAPAYASLNLSEELPEMRISLQTKTLKGNKVQVQERDTTVVIPAGPFPVTNFQTKKTNYLYQNSHLSICLQDESGKDVWGIPFKEPFCGRVQDVDYYKNGKIQFLFAAGDKLYLLDRLGKWVNGFPVKLSKPVLLGPDVYDFTGIGGYTVMVLHKDNTLERYNLHGQKPEGWKGIRAPETVKDLPELIQVGGKNYWVVRTGIRTLVYPFAGGESLLKEEGGKMLRPDTRLKIGSKGVSGECYDGRNREYKLN